MPRDEHDVVAGVSRAGGAIWRTAHSRAHRFVPVSLSCVRSPSSPSSLSFSLVLFLSLSLSLSLSSSLSGTFSFARLHSYTTVLQARQRRDQATRKDHLVLYILAPAAMILSTAFKNIRRPSRIS